MEEIFSTWYSYITIINGAQRAVIYRGDRTYVTCVKMHRVKTQSNSIVSVSLIFTGKPVLLIYYFDEFEWDKDYARKCFLALMFTPDVNSSKINVF